MNDGLIPIIRKHLHTAQRVLCVSHIHPDGDAVGSLLGLGLALQTIGKEVQIVLEDGVPVNYSYLHGSEQISTKPSGHFDFVIALDSSEISRVGHMLDFYGRPDLNIDHHITNTRFALINWVDTSAAATAQILAQLMPELDLPFTQPVVDALLTGILTDTIGFRTSNVNGQVLQTTSVLIDAGANLSSLYQQALLRRSIEAIRYWGAGLSQVQRDGPIVWTSLSLANRTESNYPGRDDADLINVLSTIQDAEIAIIFIEQNEHQVKVSWRSRESIDVASIAQQFGGGGHRQAAGAEIEGELDSVCKKVLDFTRNFIVD